MLVACDSDNYAEHTVAHVIRPPLCRGGSYTPELCQALARGDHTVVSEAELLDFAENTLNALAAKQASVVDHLFAGTGPEYSYTTAKSDIYVNDIQSPENTFVALLANKQTGSNDIRKITGVLAERNGQRIGLCSKRFRRQCQRSGKHLPQKSGALVNRWQDGGAEHCSVAPVLGRPEAAPENHGVIRRAFSHLNG